MRASVDKLASTQFDAVRKAQREIALHGTNALPALEEVLQEGHPLQQKALAWHIIGEIDAMRYVSLLCAMRAQDLEVASMYLNEKALSGMSQEAIKELTEHLRSLESSVNAGQGDHLQRIRAALPK